jgi:hypothetical protein
MTFDKLKGMQFGTIEITQTAITLHDGWDKYTIRYHGCSQCGARISWIDGDIMATIETPITDVTQEPESDFHIVVLTLHTKLYDTKIGWALNYHQCGGAEGLMID